MGSRHLLLDVVNAEPGDDVHVYRPVPARESFGEVTRTLQLEAFCSFSVTFQAHTKTDTPNAEHDTAPNANADRRAGVATIPKLKV